MRNILATVVAALLILPGAGTRTAGRPARLQPQTRPRRRQAAGARGKQAAPATPPAPAVAVEPGFTIGPEDVLGVLFWRDAEMSGDVTVRSDGMITLPLVRDIKAAGLTPTSWPTASRRPYASSSPTPRHRRRPADEQPQGLHHRRGGEARRLPGHLLVHDRDAADCGGRRPHRVGRVGQHLDHARGERQDAGRSRSTTRTWRRARRPSRTSCCKPGDTVVVPER